MTNRTRSNQHNNIGGKQLNNSAGAFPKSIESVRLHNGLSEVVVVFLFHLCFRRLMAFVRRFSELWKVNTNRAAPIPA